MDLKSLLSIWRANWSNGRPLTMQGRERFQPHQIPGEEQEAYLHAISYAAHAIAFASFWGNAEQITHTIKTVFLEIHKSELHLSQFVLQATTQATNLLREAAHSTETLTTTSRNFRARFQTIFGFIV